MTSHRFEALDPSVTGHRVAGVDEAGRGPLAGPVVAAAVMLDPGRPLAGLDDSKKLGAPRREALDAAIRGQALAFAVVFVDRVTIDRVNILQATLLAMAKAIEGLDPRPERVLVDGNQLPRAAVPCRAEVKGDARFRAIAAASILAKVARDRYMIELESRYPGYGFARHKGYGTRDHCAALEHLGATPEHRRSFAPVRAVLARAGAATR